MSERFPAWGEGINENDTSSCCVSLVLKEYLDVEARDVYKEKGGLQGLFIMSQNRKATYSWEYAYKAVCVCVSGCIWVPILASS